MDSTNPSAEAHHESFHPPHHGTYFLKKGFKSTPKIKCMVYHNEESNPLTGLTLHSCFISWSLENSWNSFYSQFLRLPILTVKKKQNNYIPTWIFDQNNGYCGRRRERRDLCQHVVLWKSSSPFSTRIRKAKLHIDLHHSWSWVAAEACLITEHLNSLSKWILWFLTYEF